MSAGNNGLQMVLSETDFRVSEFSPVMETIDFKRGVLCLSGLIEYSLLGVLWVSLYIWEILYTVNVSSFLLVFLGSGLGGGFRWLLSAFMGPIQAHQFPWATYIANVMACTLAGFMGAWISGKSDSHPVTLFGLIGFCGGFSTMSAFSREWFLYMQGGHVRWLVLYPLLMVVSCLACTVAGAWLYTRCGGENGFISMGK